MFEPGPKAKQNVADTAGCLPKISKSLYFLTNRILILFRSTVYLVQNIYMPGSFVGRGGHVTEFRSITVRS